MIHCWQETFDAAFNACSANSSGACKQWCGCSTSQVEPHGRDDWSALKFLFCQSKMTVWKEMTARLLNEMQLCTSRDHHKVQRPHVSMAMQLAFEDSAHADAVALLHTLITLIVPGMAHFLPYRPVKCSDDDAPSQGWTAPANPTGMTFRSRDGRRPCRGSPGK